MSSRANASVGVIAVVAALLSTACTLPRSSVTVRAAPAASARSVPVPAGSHSPEVSAASQAPSSAPVGQDTSAAPVLAALPLSELQGTDWQRAVDAIGREVSAIDASLSRHARSLEVEAEDATSATWSISWSTPGGEVVKRREAWNGGCCGAAQIKDHYYRHGKLIKRVMWLSPREQMTLIGSGTEPRSGVKLAFDDYDDRGRVLRTFVDNLLLGKTTAALF